MENKFTDDVVMAAMSAQNEEASKILKDPDKLERFLQQLEKKLKKIPGIGYLDDAAVIGFCLKMTQDDVEDYKKWRKTQGKEI